MSTAPPGSQRCSKGFTSSPAVVSGPASLLTHSLVLWLAMMLVNALWVPYRGIDHDAMFYAFETINQLENERYVDELTECYLASGKFSIFSSITRPIVARFGVNAGFFCLYLAAKGFFLWSMMRLVRLLVPQPMIAATTLLFLAGTGIPFGGVGAFHVNEAFLTPRLPAIGLSLCGLASLLEGRTLTALAWTGAAAGFHPIMALAGLLVWCTTVLWKAVSPRAFVLMALVAMAGAVVIVCVPSCGVRVFGEMDDRWRDFASRANPYSRPATWTYFEHAKIAWAMAVVAAAAWLLPQPPIFKIALWAALVMGLAGLSGSFLAPLLPYALLLQAQTYRTLWLVQFLQIPLGIGLAHHVSRVRSIPRLIIAFTLIESFLMPSWSDGLLTCGLFGIVIMFFGWGRTLPRTRQMGAVLSYGQAVKSALLALVVMAVTNAWGVIGTFAALFEQQEPRTDAYFWWTMTACSVGPVIMLMSVMGAIHFSHRWMARSSLVAALLLSTIAVHTTALWLPFSSIQRRLGSRNYVTGKMVRDYVGNDSRDDGPPLHIYWSNGHLPTLWFGVRAKSYFCWNEVAGTMFLRSSALAGQHRAAQAARCDAHSINLALPMTPTILEGQRYAYGAAFPDLPAPTWDEMERFALEEKVDLVITSIAFPGRYAAKSEYEYLYDFRSTPTNDL